MNGHNSMNDATDSTRIVQNPVSTNSITSDDIVGWKRSWPSNHIVDAPKATSTGSITTSVLDKLLGTKYDDTESDLTSTQASMKSLERMDIDTEDGILDTESSSELSELSSEPSSESAEEAHVYQYLHRKDAETLWLENMPKFLGSEYAIMNYLGQGTQNMCFKVVHRSTGKLYALKHVKITRDHDTPDQPTKAFAKEVLHSRLDLQHEVEMMINQNHPNICDMKAELIECVPPFQGIILDYWESSLHDLTRGHAEGLQATEENVWTFFCQAASALNYLHAQKICHLDIKPPNVLFNVRHATRSKRRAPELVFCLTDFGSSFYEEEKAVNVGTSFYAAPETMTHAPKASRGACTASDIWSLMVTVLDALAAGDIRQIMDNPDIDADTEDGYEYLVTVHRSIVEHDLRFRDFKDCLAIDPAERPTAAELIDRQNDMLGFGRRDAFK